MPFDVRPKYATFDCYGTLIHWQMNDVTRQVLGDRLPPDQADAFLDSFSIYRFDEVMGDWKPYGQVIADALQRAATRHGIELRSGDGEQIYAAIPTWGPHPDVPDGLARLAEHVPLVILSNATDDQIVHNVEKLGAPFAEVLTAEQARAYKPRLAAFEYMLDKLGCAPGEIVHVSSSPRYDHMSAYDLGIRNTVYVNRGDEPSAPFYYRAEIPDVSHLPGLFGL